MTDPEAYKSEVFAENWSLRFKIAEKDAEITSLTATAKEHLSLINVPFFKFNFHSSIKIRFKFLIKEFLHYSLFLDTWP